MRITDLAVVLGISLPIIVFGSVYAFKAFRVYGETKQRLGRLKDHETGQG